MENLKTIGEALTKCTAEMKALAEKAKSAEGDAVTTISEAFDAKKAELATLKGRYERAKCVADALSEAEELAKSATAAATREISVDAPHDGERAKGHQIGPNLKADSDRELFGIFRTFLSEGHKAPVMSDRAKTALDYSRGTSPVSGKEEHCVVAPLAVQRFFTERAKTNTLSLSTDATGYSTDSGSFNGIDPNFQAELQKYEVFMPNLYQYASPINVYNGRALFPRLDQKNAGKFGGVQVYTRAEGETVSQSQMYLTSDEVKTISTMAIAFESRENLSRAAFGREAELLINMRNATQDKWSEMCLTGRGPTTYYETEGILNNATVIDVDREAAGQLQYKDFVNLKGALKIARRNNGRFVLADSAAIAVQSEIDNEGRPLFAEHVGVGIRNTIINYPFVVHEYDSPVAHERGDVIFGDMRNYWFGVEDNITIARSEDVEFLRNGVAFRVVSWVAGRVRHPDAFAILKA